VSIPINNESYVEGNTTFNLTLANPSGGTVGGPALATVTIVDDDTVNPPTVNINDSAGAFVCQQYHDFLDRDSDAGGMAFWTAKITADPCVNAACTPSRTDVAEAYFKSAEFSQTGSFVLLAYQASFGTTAFTPGAPGGHGLPLPAATYVQFQSDRSRIVATGGSTSGAQLAFLNQFITRPAWVATGLGSVNNNLYVSALDGNTGGVMTAANKAALISGLNGGTLTRAQVLQAFTQDPQVLAKFNNQMFVAMQYFGYLRRDPDAGGFDFWLNLLNTTTPADARNMTCNFITATEYQSRFSSVNNHSNAECGTVHGAIPPPEQ
jgi:hypothetical protein